MVAQILNNFRSLIILYGAFKLVYLLKWKELKAVNIIATLILVKMWRDE